MKLVKAKLLTSSTDFGGYITYVFEKEEYTSAYDHYVMCTRFPNWMHEHISIGDIGFLSYKEVEAGTDTWYDNESGMQIPYKYTGVHFLKFIKDTPTSKEIIL